jgi:ERCC4-type nuclease
MEIIVDTREQLPLFKNNVIRFKLEVGDYSTLTLRHSFAIERKSPQDLYGSLIQGHVRFMNEIYLSQRRGIELVIFVECPYKTFVDKKFYGASRLKMPCETLKKIVDTTFKRRGVEVVWCASRDIMIKKVRHRLKQEELKRALPKARREAKDRRPINTQR